MVVTVQETEDLSGMKQIGVNDEGRLERVGTISRSVREHLNQLLDGVRSRVLTD